MPRPAPAPTRSFPRTPPPPRELALEHRLALIDASMTLRLEEALIAFDVDTANATTTLDLDEVITVPAPDLPQPTPGWRATPIAALLHRAYHRLLTSGWCSGSLTNAQGAVCLLGSIRAEAGGNRDLERQAIGVLHEAIQRVFHDAETVPSFNDACTSARVPVHMAARAIDLADARGL
ncbi:hypothetical protein [Streptomyces sp. MNP-20]|uniref:DUF6197 family protein n=1 Tax=Streptomyces sp. MNP-20 TaxID=2721165 RepID=UPI0015523D27|nr:hypothetical protein [Streptomyces sp. MNP-20]